MRSRAVRRPLACWASIASAPPPSRVFSSSLRTWATSSARARMLDSKRSELGSTPEVRTLFTVRAVEPVRSAMRAGSETTNYTSGGAAGEAPALRSETRRAASLLVDSDSKMSRKLKSRPDWQIALAMTVAGRVFFSAVAAVFSLFLHPDAALIHSNALTESLPAPHGLHYALLGIWERFDTLWYLRIAQHGYDLPMAVIFYPLYPLAIRAASWGLPAIAAAL